MLRLNKLLDMLGARLVISMFSRMIKVDNVTCSMCMTEASSEESDIDSKACPICSNSSPVQG